MISRGKVLGVIEVLNKFNQQDFNETDVNLLSTLACIAAMAIDWLGSEEAGDDSANGTNNLRTNP